MVQLNANLIPAEVPNCETSIEGTHNGYIALAKLAGVTIDRGFFSSVRVGVDQAYANAKAFLSRYEPRCGVCGVHFSPAPGARCSCGACEGGDL